MADYRFVTTWQLRSPLDPVWQALVEAERWPEWWRGVIRVDRLATGDGSGVGDRYRQVWRSRLPYNLEVEVEVVRVQPQTLIEGRATGELEGTGTWWLTHEDGITTVEYTWAVRTTSRWMNLLAPIARPFFAWNHDNVMARGGEGLARLTGAELLLAK